MTSGEVVVAIQRKRLIRAFKRALATSPDKAIYPEEHGLRMGFIFKKLVRQKVLVQTSSSKYYLNEEKETELRKVRLVVVVALLVIIITLAIMMVFLHI
jgi:hypothetical protein